MNDLVCVNHYCIYILLQVCYAEEEIDVGGETVVNAGCRLREVNTNVYVAHIV